MERRGILFIMIDGMGSLPVRDGKTEWEITKTPNLDALAKRGVYGLMNPIGPGITPGSDTSHLNIFGYDPHIYYPGRGPLEALGAGIKLMEGDVAFRANLATVNRNMVVVDRRAGRIESADAARIAKSIERIEIDGLEFTFTHTVEHRGVVVVRGKGITASVGDTDPHEEGREVVQPEITAENERMARAIGKYTIEVYKRLSKHKLNKGRKLPANVVLLRGAGMYREVETFQKRFGMSACCIAGGALYKGIGRYIGMDVINVKGATATFDTDLAAKARAALKCLEKYDFVFLHIKAMDSQGHDGNVEKRIEMIKRIDRMVGMLADTKAVIVVTGDHSTPPTKRMHSFEPVPILISNVEARGYGINKFCEVGCAWGELGTINGSAVVPMLLAYAGRTEKYGT